VVEGLAAALDLDRGRVASARRRFEDAQPATVLPRWAARHAVGRAVAAGMAGDAEAASAAAASAASAALPAGHPDEPEVQLAGAWAAAAAGLVSVARSRAREAARLAVRQPAVEVVALHTAVQFGDRTVARRLAELAGRVDGLRAPAAAAHAEALAAGDGDGLLAAADRLDDLGAALLAADAAAQAVTVFDGQGRHAEAQAAARRMAQLLLRCPGANTPARRAADRVLPLSEREREVVELVAAGRSNREAAVALGISVRTVEGHVYRACMKLDVHDRADLAAIVAR
jgi:DNA-binding CsgD family transcriptional regulator